MKNKNVSKLVVHHNRTWGDIPSWSYTAIRSMMETLKIVDLATYEHCLRVGESCRRLSRAMGLNDYEQRLAHISGMLHDIGKVGIQKSILHKPARLTDEEFLIMKEHPIMSEKIIEPFAEQNAFLKDSLSGIRGHHERLDGTGYPDKLAGDKIPLNARIVLVSDTFDAMVSNRAYRQGLSVDDIYAELKRYSGSQFDTSIVKIFLEAHPKWNTEKDIDSEVFEKVVKRAA